MKPLLKRKLIPYWMVVPTAACALVVGKAAGRMLALVSPSLPGKVHGWLRTKEQLLRARSL